MNKHSNLDKYICSRCGSSPKSAEEILKTGCSNCGNGFFKIKQVDYEKGQSKQTTPHNVKDNQDITIAVEDRGIYNIDLEDLLDDNKPLVIGGKGVYRVSLKNNRDNI